MMLTEDNVDTFWDAIAEGKVIKHVDLLAANPDIRAQVTRGYFKVFIIETEFEGARYFIAQADDGSDEYELDALNAMVKICTTEAEAQEALDGLILDWKYAWSL